MSQSSRTVTVLARLACLAGVFAALPASGAAAAVTVPSGFSVSTFAGPPTGRIQPDDITWFGGHVYVAFQNGVGPDGAPSSTGSTQSTLVEYDSAGHPINSWDLTGKADGMAGDPAHDRVIVTANEDQHSRLYTVDPDAAPGSQVTAYTYSPDPGASGTGGVHTGGGTDAVSIYNGDIFVSASNPNDGTSAAGPNPSATAVFEVSLDSSTGTAKLSETFADNAPATDGATGQSTTLNLGDPDSNAVVPESSPRFGGDFMLDGQADNQLVFAGPFDSPGNPTLLTTLNLSHGGTPAGVDDVRWAEGSGGTLYVVDNSHNQVLAIAGPFQAGQAFASLDHVGATATTTELDSVDLGSGALTAFASGLGKSKGLLYVPAEAGDQAQSGAKDSGEAAPDSSTGRSEPVATNGGSAGNEPSSTSKPSAKHSVHGTKRSHRRHPRQAHRTRRRHHKPGTARHRA